MRHTRFHSTRTRRLAAYAASTAAVAGMLVIGAPAANAGVTVQIGPFSTQVACNQAAMLDKSYYASVGRCYNYITDRSKWYYKRTNF